MKAKPKLDSEQWKKASRIVLEARELPTSERPQFIERACAEDETLQQEVHSLLAAGDRVAGFMAQPVVSLHAPRRQRIGRYRVLEPIARGGMGTVYRAVRDEDDQQVAIKVLSRALGDPISIQRFHAERRILACLEHPNIARLLDGGTTEDDLPYLVLEYIEGQRIDRWCDHHRLTVRQRVELFIQVCAAVEHAHNSLIIHRDIKPSNILVTADGVPKLLDFGIAKILDSGPVSADAPTALQVTSPGTQPMTLLYASPEQVDANAPLTTASDVYSLGVVLYQLLTGFRPYSYGLSTLQLMRAVLQEEPSELHAVVERESTASCAGEECEWPDLARIASSRSGDPRALSRQLRGDLNCITLKALRKEVAERYRSVEQLATDLARYLEGLPVMARKGTVLYKTGKFIQRHRRRLVSIAALVTMIACGLLWHQQQLLHERSLAEEVQDLADRPPASEEQAFARQLGSLVGRFGDSESLTEKLNDAAFASKTEGELDRAEMLYREALAMKERLSSEPSYSLATGLHNLATTVKERGNLEEAVHLADRSLQMRIELYGENSLPVASSLSLKASLVQDSGDPLTAAPMLHRALLLRQQLLGDNHQAVAPVLNNLAHNHFLIGEFEQAEKRYLETLELLRQQGSEEHEARVLRSLALVRQAQGRHQEAEVTARKALDIYRRNRLHWQIADAESVLASCLTSLGQFEEAEQLLEISLPVIEAAKGESARQSREARQRLEELHVARGHLGSS